MNWKALQQLNELYTKGETDVRLLKHSYIERQVENGRIIVRDKLLLKTAYFDEFYEKKHAIVFENIKTLLIRYDIAHTNFKAKDLNALLKIEIEKQHILDSLFSQKEISTHYFDDSKYLKTGSKLHKAILRILALETLRRDEHDQQFLYVLHCKSKIPKAIVLCENINNLQKPRLEDIELWHAGGNNIAKLAYVPSPQIPMYYLCDWDNKGIEIYQSIKKRFFPQIEIIIPASPKYLPAKSTWHTTIDSSLFITNALQLLNYLISNDLWIEEESISSVMLKLF